MTTTGYGDVAPLHPSARSLCNMEAIFGQLYPATLVARRSRSSTAIGTAESHLRTKMSKTTPCTVADGSTRHGPRIRRNI
nr:ion channel [Bradyrhizobium forestalis]